MTIRERSKGTCISQCGVMSVVLSAVDFIIIHELNHVVFGHLDYLETKNQNNQGNSIPKTASVLQAMEASADYFAGFRAGKGIRDHILFSMMIPNSIDDMTHAMVMAFSIKLCFSVVAFESTFKMTEDTVTSNYPHAEIRHALFFHGFKCGVDTFVGAPDENWIGGVAKGYWAITSAFEKLGVYPPIELSLYQGMQAHYEVMAVSDEVAREINRVLHSVLEVIDLTKVYALPVLGGIEYSSCHFVS